MNSISLFVLISSSSISFMSFDATDVVLPSEYSFKEILEETLDSFNVLAVDKINDLFAIRIFPNDKSKSSEALINKIQKWNTELKPKNESRYNRILVFETRDENGNIYCWHKFLSRTLEFLCFHGDNVFESERHAICIQLLDILEVVKDYELLPIFPSRIILHDDLYLQLSDLYPPNPIDEEAYLMGWYEEGATNESLIVKIIGLIWGVDSDQEAWQRYHDYQNCTGTCPIWCKAFLALHTSDTSAVRNSKIPPILTLDLVRSKVIKGVRTHDYYAAYYGITEMIFLVKDLTPTEIRVRVLPITIDLLNAKHDTIIALVLLFLLEILEKIGFETETKPNDSNKYFNSHYSPASSSMANSAVYHSSNSQFMQAYSNSNSYNYSPSNPRSTSTSASNSNSNTNSDDANMEIAGSSNRIDQSKKLDLSLFLSFIKSILTSNYEFAKYTLFCVFPEIIKFLNPSVAQNLIVSLIYVISMDENQHLKSVFSLNFCKMMIALKEISSTQSIRPFVCQILSIKTRNLMIQELVSAALSSKAGSSLNLSETGFILPKGKIYRPLSESGTFAEIDQPNFSYSQQQLLSQSKTSSLSQSSINPMAGVSLQSANASTLNSANSMQTDNNSGGIMIADDYFFKLNDHILQSLMEMPPEMYNIDAVIDRMPSQCMTQNQFRYLIRVSKHSTPAMLYKFNIMAALPLCRLTSLAQTFVQKLKEVSHPIDFNALIPKNISNYLSMSVPVSPPPIEDSRLEMVKPFIARQLFDLSYQPENFGSFNIVSNSMMINPHSQSSFSSYGLSSQPMMSSYQYKGPKSSSKQVSSKAIQSVNSILELGQINDFTFSTDGKSVLVCNDNMIRQYPANLSSTYKFIYKCDKPEMTIDKIVAFPDSMVMATFDGATKQSSIRRVYYDNPAREHIQTYDHPITSLSRFESNNYTFFGLSNGDIYFNTSMSQKNPILLIQIGEKLGSPISIVEMPDSPNYIISTDEGNAIIYDMRIQTPLKSFRASNRPARISPYSSDQFYITCGPYLTKIDIKSLTVKQLISCGASHAIDCCCFDDWIVSAHTDLSVIALNDKMVINLNEPHKRMPLKQKDAAVIRVNPNNVVPLHEHKIVSIKACPTIQSVVTTDISGRMILYATPIASKEKK